VTAEQPAFVPSLDATRPSVNKPATITIRASSWSSLFSCAHSWEGTHLLGMHKPAGLRAQLGTALHASTAAYDQARLDERPLTIDDAADVFVQTLHHPDREVDLSGLDLSIKDAERIGLSLHANYCATIAPQFTYLSVEQTLAPLDIDCGSGVTVRLTGSMDRARVADSALGHIIPDLKSGQRVIAKGEVQIQGRSPQIGTYSLMYEAHTGQPVAGGQVIGLQTSNKPQTGVSKVFDAKRVMVGTDESPGLIAYAAEMFRTGLFPPNPQALTCSERYCARWHRCIFHDR
jgi:hypothetical protein